MVYGESGSGKTAVLAKVATEISKLDFDNYSVLLRFLGSTPISSDIIKTINSIVLQLDLIFNLPKKKRTILDQLDSKKNLLETLKMCKKMHPDKKIVIILDSINQLNPYDYELIWLVENLPDNVKMIYSTLINHGSIFPILKSKLNYEKNEKNFLELNFLDNELALTIVQDRLKENNRCLTNLQIEVLKEMFSRAALYPLYIKLIGDIVSKWTLNQVPDEEFKRCLFIDKCISYLFRSNEKTNGKMLFSSAIIYMSLFKNGITESEILDVLSIDDDVLYDTFEYHTPVVRKLPIALWVKLKNSLKEYIIEKEINNTRIIYW